MKLTSIPRWARWLFLAVTGMGVIIAATSDIAGDDGGKSARTARDRNPPAPRAENKSRVAEPGRVEIERLSAAPPAAEAPVSNVFGATSWYVPPPPPPPAPPLPPPKPTAPPMPFTFLGSYQETSQLVIFLSRGDRVYTVSLGDVIEDTYRIESIKGQSLELTYLPLNIKQTINAGGT